MTSLPAVSLWMPRPERAAREHLRAWLDELGWPSLHAADIVLAVHKAVSVAVEHSEAPGGIGAPVRVSATLDTAGRTRWLTLRVTDAGSRPDPLQAYPPAGLGQRLMRGLMQRVETCAGPLGGTEVTMLSPAVPTVAA